MLSASALFSVPFATSISISAIIAATVAVAATVCASVSAAVTTAISVSIAAAVVSSAIATVIPVTVAAAIVSSAITAVIPVTVAAAIALSNSNPNTSGVQELTAINATTGRPTMGKVKRYLSMFLLVRTPFSISAVLPEWTRTNYLCAGCQSLAQLRTDLG